MHLHEKKNLLDVKQRISIHPFPSDCKPDISRGLFWQRRTGKECILMVNDHDWSKAKHVYTKKNGHVGDLQLAVHAAVVSAKRKFSSDEEEVGEKLQKTKNDYNKVQASIIRVLNNKGTCDRYTSDHLRVWTELIQQGKVCRPEEEPNWSKYLDQVQFFSRTETPSRRPQPFDLQQYLMISDERQQRRDESFRNQMMLFMMAGKALPLDSNKCDKTNNPLSEWCASRPTFERK